MERRQHFSHTPLPYLLLAPQIVIIGVFFIYPAAQAIYLSFMLEDPWGLSSTFVWFENYQLLFTSSDYLESLGFTLLFSVLVSFLSLALALLLAVKADNIIHGQGPYRITLTWVYAVAPAVAGIIGGFLFNPHIGVLTDLFERLGWQFSFQTDPVDATIALVLVSVWKQISVNFVYFLAGLQSISYAVREAALLDCQSDNKRFWTITFPLLAPTGFFLLVINLTYAFFETFGVIDTMTNGGPGGSTTSLVYKVYRDGFVGADLGGSSAQSVVLLVLVLLLTWLQFRFVEKRVHY
ncbi:ABC-type sugar transport system, permease component [Vibrio vulnificus YJ016]|uniref:sn-glycerol-3-phosphate transport system permease protein UgpA n=2 Tax=Vibrio vulnificus TaxID=672 RepID=A0A2S3R8B3_VIBVL|nr:ABC transporter permease subunit [Vibrio vulnificus]ADV86729.1 SN-glycerol-3-phosphate transport system permease protein UgpA [Vibrio vulnificus MO6-24/O]AIL70509.1 sugar ABC transporter permease [Vibrio vulnificus]ANN26764.1 Glycerol-3-phosphate ABC transporter, permease protein UgpA [Vibrio vulnificus]AUJ34941.1 glycerol-3-phosphate transporter permease [Vibrio vulnificus]AXX60015.1 SN-glycerol-3-phosphate transport system permease protein ugpA [Vibrio vulnificus]